MFPITHTVLDIRLRCVCFVCESVVYYCERVGVLVLWGRRPYIVGEINLIISSGLRVHYRAGNESRGLELCADFYNFVVESIKLK